MFSNFYIQQRLKKAVLLAESGQNPYGTNALRSLNNKEFLEKYSYLDTQDSALQADTQASTSESTDSKKASTTESIVGRVRFIRLMGKACFIKIEDQSGILQAYVSKNDVGERFEEIKKILEVGDIIGVSGFAFVTKSGELSIHAQDFRILCKAIIPLPEKFHGLSDVELRYRQRYVDLIVNDNVKKTFILRSKIIASIREFFDNLGFLEVETPMLHPIPGGANAKPFVTHHNALDVERYLRIAPELYLKRLIVGGFEAIYEINRNFRNEGIDHSHNPEFSSIEFYWAYHTFSDLITLTKELFAFLFERLELPSVLQFGEMEIDFSKWETLSYKQSLQKIGGLDSEIIENKERLESYLREAGIKLAPNLSYGKLLDEAFGSFVESKLINPTFIVEYPIEISPLARRSEVNPDIAERFELFIGGREIANGFNELNDPLDQKARFEEQVAQKDAGDEEAQYMDEDFLWALGYGMPPTAGEGIGIDRLVMLLTNNKSIKDVILFPALKPHKGNYDILEGKEK